MTHTQSEKVRVNYINGQTNARILHLQLNKEKALNALDLDMVLAMQSALDAALDDQSITAVFIDSAGDRAFCAGGDIVSMYQAMNESAADADTAPSFLYDFFRHEYRLDYTIHCYPKPIIAWGNGIIMGGGLGIFSASHIKIATANARIAMPEISIGLFPDVGGSYFLTRLKQGVGHFLGLTGASVNVDDALKLNLADYALRHEDKAAVIRAFASLNECSIDSINQCLASFALTPNHDNCQLYPLVDSLHALSGCTNAIEAQSLLSRLVVQSDLKQNSYLQKAYANLLRGSPITAHLVVEQLNKAKGLSLANCFQMELNMALTCACLGEFKEGVRALLIDKDNQPRWLYDTIESVDPAIIEQHFNYFERRQLTNPLNDLK